MHLPAARHLLLLALALPPRAAGAGVTGRAFATRPEVAAQHGMACTSQPLATRIALDVLKRGGSAVDAALGLMEPTGAGLGTTSSPPCGTRRRSVAMA